MIKAIIKPNLLKRNKELLIGFLNQNAGKMPRTALRYSIEKLSVKEKEHFMGMKR